MTSEALTTDDRALVDEAEAALADLSEHEFHTVAAAIQTPSGATYSGIDLVPSVGTAGIHAEPIAIGRAIMNGEQGLETSVAVTGDMNDPRVISACGVCRELIHSYAPEARVIVPGSDAPVKRPIGVLLPDKD